MNDQAFLPPRDGDDDASYAWLDEWLCEYVDGTMDPSLRAVFETYVDANPELKAHIEQLNETRDLLGQRGRPSPPSPEKRRRVCDRVQTRVCRKVECEMLRQQASLVDLIRDHSRAALGIASSMAVALIVGIFTGALLFGPPSTSSSGPMAATSTGSPGGSLDVSASSSAVSSVPPSTSSSTSPSATYSLSSPMTLASTGASSSSGMSLLPASQRAAEDVPSTSALDHGTADRPVRGYRAPEAETAKADPVKAPPVGGDLAMTPWPGGTATSLDAAWSWSLVLTGPGLPFLAGSAFPVSRAEERHEAETTPVLTSHR